MKTIVLSRGKVATVSRQDFVRLSRFSWYARKCKGGGFYAVRIAKGRDGKRHAFHLHREVLGLRRGKPEVDHRDGDGLNNCRSNLRVATRSQNCRGFRRKKLGTYSKYRGVTFRQDGEKWQAQIKVFNQCRYLGLFAEEQDAARAYDRAAKQIFGRFACPNF